MLVKWEEAFNSHKLLYLSAMSVLLSVCVCTHHCSYGLGNENMFCYRQHGNWGSSTRPTCHYVSPWSEFSLMLQIDVNKQVAHMALSTVPTTLFSSLFGTDGELFKLERKTLKGRKVFSCRFIPGSSWKWSAHQSLAIAWNHLLDERHMYT